MGDDDDSHTIGLQAAQRGEQRLVTVVVQVGVGFIEHDEQKKAARDYLNGFLSSASFDYLWFTPPAERDDPCKQ